MATSLPAAHPPAAGVSPKPWGIPAILAGLVVPTALWAWALALVLADKVPSDASDAEIMVSILISVIVLDGALVAAPLIVCSWRYRLNLSALGLRPLDNEHWWVPPVVAAGAYLAATIYGIVLNAAGLSPKQDIDELFDSAIVLPVTFLATVLVAPLAEELFFRGFVFSGLIRPLGVTGAIVSSGLLFAMFHVQDANSALLVPPFAAIGAGFAWAYHRTGSLWASIGAHFLFNITSFVLLALAAAMGNT